MPEEQGKIVVVRCTDFSGESYKAGRFVQFARASNGYDAQTRGAEHFVLVAIREAAKAVS
jgi:hypothetical protein